jgi:hypothetical protein
MWSSEKNRLLTETLCENREYEAFRSSTFKAGLAELRKMRRAAPFWTQWPLAASVTFCIGVAIWGITRKSDHPQVVVESSVDSFASRPLSSAEFVRSKPDPRLFVQTAKNEAHLDVIKTEQVPLIELSDEDLLAAFGDKPVGFVQSNGHFEFMVLEN